MGNPKAFLTIPRQEAGYRPIHDRINDFSEVEQTLNTGERKLQASRCMDCGVPFCHWACPLGNRPPEFQDALYKGKWQEAYEILSQTNDFPEFTGRVCPALCEKSCVLKLSIDAPVTIREDEAAIIEAAFREGYVKPHCYKRNGKSVAVVGSGPTGLAAANQLNRRGYEVTVYEKQEYIGGLLRFGIPNFKLNKPIIDRRIQVMEAEGIHPILISAYLHDELVRIHPFIDGNGRTSRLLMNLYLLRNGYTLVNLKGDDKAKVAYYTALESSHVDKHPQAFQQLVAEAEAASLRRYLTVLGATDIQ